MASGASVLNLSAFSTSELNAILTAAKAEVLTRLTGRVQQGSSTGQSYSMNLYTIDELNRLINSLTDALGLDTQETRVRPNFSGCSEYSTD
jgi:hypothetical protein